MRTPAVILLAAALGVAMAVPGAVVRAHEPPREQIARLDRHLVDHPGDADALLQRAELQRRAGHVERAVADVEAAAEASPGLRAVVLERALVRLELGCYGLAEVDLDTLVEAGPPSWEVFAARANARERGERWTAAREDYDRALALRPLPELYLARGHADERRGAMEAARDGYREALLRLGPAVPLVRAVVRAELSTGSPERAIAVLTDMLERAKVRTEWLLLRAVAYDAAGRGADAERDRVTALSDARELLGKKPSALARLSLARALAANGQLAEARAALRAVRAEAPQIVEGDDAAVLAVLTEPARRMDETH